MIKGGQSTPLLPTLKQTQLSALRELQTIKHPERYRTPGSQSELQVISSNGRISRIIGKPPPKTDGTDPNNLRYTKLTALYQRPDPVQTVFCEICGSEFRKATLPVHIRNCFKRYQKRVNQNEQLTTSNYDMRKSMSVKKADKLDLDSLSQGSLWVDQQPLETFSMRYTRNDDLDANIYTSTPVIKKSNVPPREDLLQFER